MELSRGQHARHADLPTRIGVLLPFCVCVPARDEAARLGPFLDALAAQDVAGAIDVAICLNNTTDASAAVIGRARADHAGRLAIRLDEHRFPPALAHAGSARGRAMDAGLSLLRSCAAGVLLTTDADSRPPPDWISGNLRAIEAGADIVGGRLVMDEAEPMPPAVLACHLRWQRYWQRVRAIEDSIDPRAWDPAPRHGDHTGGSIALTAAIYRAAGGVPAIPTDEDHGLVRAAIAAGGRLAHPMSVWTRVSPRRDGRATGGMADAIAELYRAAATGRVLMAPNFGHWRERAAWRLRLRGQPGGAARIAREEPRLPPMPCDTPLVDLVPDP